MKIICDSQEEYDALMKVSKDIHDHRIYIEGVGKKAKRKELLDKMPEEDREFFK